MIKDLTFFSVFYGLNMLKLNVPPTRFLSHSSIKKYSLFVAPERIKHVPKLCPHFSALHFFLFQIRKDDRCFQIESCFNMFQPNPQLPNFFNCLSFEFPYLEILLFSPTRSKRIPLLCQIQKIVDMGFTQEQAKLGSQNGDLSPVDLQCQH